MISARGAASSERYACRDICERPGIETFLGKQHVRIKIVETLFLKHNFYFRGDRYLISIISGRSDSHNYTNMPRKQ